jgi:hypothetical protein
VSERRSSRDTQVVRVKLMESHCLGQRQILFSGWQSPLQRGALHAAGRRYRRRVSDHPHHRPRRQSVSLRHPDAADRALGGSLSRTACRNSPDTRRPFESCRRRLDHGRVAPRRLHPGAQVVKTIRPDTVFIPYHWAGRRSVNQLTISAQDPISKIPEFKVCAVRLKKAEREPEYASRLESQQ